MGRIGKNIRPVRQSGKGTHSFSPYRNFPVRNFRKFSPAMASVFLRFNIVIILIRDRSAEYGFMAISGHIVITFGRSVSEILQIFEFFRKDHLPADSRQKPEIFPIFQIFYLNADPVFPENIFQRNVQPRFFRIWRPDFSRNTQGIPF